MALDIRTLIVVLGITHLIQAGVFLQQYTMRKNYPGIGWWLMWSAAEVGGFVFMLLRQIPNIHSFAIIAQNALIVAGTICLYVGVMKFLERRVNWQGLVTFFVACMAALLFFLYVQDNIPARTVILSVALITTGLLTAKALFSGRRPSISGLTVFLAATFLLHSGVFMYRLIMILLGTPYDNIFAPTLFNYIPSLDAIIAGLVWTFGLVLLITVRMNEEMREAKDHFEAIFNTGPDASLVTRLQDGFIVNVNQGFLRLSGFSRDETIGNSTLAMHVWDDLDARSQVVTKLSEKGFCDNEEMVFRRKDGSNLDGLISAHVVSLHDAPHVISVIRDISKRKQNEQAILEKNAELERFTYTVSHDLKSPLATIQTFLTFLTQDVAAANAEKIETDIGFMRSAADKMDRMLSELLQLSRVGRTESAPVCVAFQEVVEEALTTVAGRLAQGNVKVERGDEAVMLYADRHRLVEIWQNLIENSVKYSGEQTAPCIEIGVTHSGYDTIFFVRDNGMGIDPRHQEKVFGLFNQLNPKCAGSGLGLALVKRIVELYEGRIWIESEGLETGTTFYFTLPKAIRNREARNSAQ